MAKRNRPQQPVRRTNKLQGSWGRFESLEKRDLFAVTGFQVSGSTLNVYGTSGNDAFEFTAGSQYRVALNGDVRTYNASSISKINFVGGGGTDAAVLTGGSSAETAKLSPNSGTLTGSGYTLTLSAFFTIDVRGDAADQAWLYDSKQNETFVGTPLRSELLGSTFNNIAAGFGKVNVYATAGGTDTASLYDSAGDDTFLSLPTYSSLSGAGYYLYVSSFDSVSGYALNGGNDTANLHDSSGNDTFTARPDQARFIGSGFDNLAQSFERVNAYARTGGVDKAYLYDSSGDDTFLARSTYAYMSGIGYYNYTEAFDEVYGAAIYGGYDTAWLYDSAGNDSFVARPTQSYLTGSKFYNSARDFDRVNAYANGGGNDTAWLYDSAGDDTFTAYPTWARLSGSGFDLLANQFDKVNASAASGGNDQAFLYDSSGDDSFVGRPTYSYLSGNGFYNYVDRFDSVQAFAGNGGFDTAWLYDSAGNDTLLSRPTNTSLSGTGFLNSVSQFARLYAYATAGGFDTATVYGTSSADTFWARDVQGRMSGTGYNNYFTSFDTVRTVVDSVDRVDTSGVSYSLMVENDPTSAITIGGGILYPFKVLAHPTQANTLLAITGSGESGGTGWLYRLDATTLTPIGDPINVGVNASDLKTVGQYLVVSSRGSSDLHLIDLAAWREIDRIASVNEAISITALPNNRFAVVGIRSDRVQLLSVAGGRFALVQEAGLAGISYDLTASVDGTRLYVNLPVTQQVQVLDAATLATVRFYNTGGAPSYGGLSIGNYYIATDRDGVMRFINTTTHAITTIDIAPLLGLNPANVPLRGIDPKDFIVVGPNRVLLVNDRQDSLLLDLNLTSSTPNVTVVGRTTGAAFGTYLSASNEVLLVQPTLHQIDRVPLSDPSLPVSNVIVGIGLGASVHVPQSGVVAVLTSQHKLMLIDEPTGQVRELAAPAGFAFSASAPLAVDGNGNLVTMAYTSNKTWQLLRVTTSGTVIGSYDLQLTGSVFSVYVNGNYAQLIDRLNSQVQLVNFATGNSTLTILSRSRAREGIVFSDGSWLVAHDTNPDIGVTLYRNGVAQFFAVPQGLRWLSDVAQLDATRVVMSDFGGNLVVFNTATNSYGPITALPFSGVTNVYSDGTTIYAISPTAGKVAVVNATTLAIRDVWSISDVVGVTPATGGAWVVTNTAAIWKPLV